MNTLSTEQVEKMLPGFGLVSESQNRADGDVWENEESGEQVRVNTLTGEITPIAKGEISVSKMDELKLAVEKISDILGCELDTVEIRLKPSGDDEAKKFPNGQRTYGVQFTKQAADKVHKHLQEIGLKPYNTFDLDNGTSTQDYTLDNLKVSVWYCPDPIDRIAMLEAELAKVREQEAIQ